MNAASPLPIEPADPPFDPVATARLALACLDLTSLNEADTEATVDALAAQAQGPAGRPAALCVWPRLAAHAKVRAPAGVAVAAVANFPEGTLDTARALADTRAIVAAGADEVDLVLPWRALLAGDAAGAAALVRAVRAACPGRVLKLIIESGELAEAGPIAQACAIGLDAGVDFLKTSTGKVPVGATPAAAAVMLAAIATHPRGATAGFKASGGVRSLADAALYIGLVRQHLGEQALTPRRLRFGASGLLAEIQRALGGPASSAGQPNGY